MAEMEKKPVKIVETILRDAHQSLIATRMSTEQMLPIVEKLDKVGYHSVECWGGATFDASLRFLKEDPWDRLRKFRDGFKNTKLQMLFRGQNILGYRPYADDVVEYFVQKSIANGIDIIRIFDCLNDLRNLQTAVKAANKEKGHAQVALSYTLGDAYTLDYWVDMAKKVEGYIKLQIPAGKATPAPPVGPALGQHGVNIVQFTKEFNARTADKGDVVIPVVITVYADRSFSFITKTPPAAVLLKKACNLKSGSGVPNKNKVATISKDKIKEIAETKMPDLNAGSLEAAMSMIAGTARSMGIVVED